MSAITQATWGRIDILPIDRSGRFAVDHGYRFNPRHRPRVNNRSEAYCQRMYWVEYAPLSRFVPISRARLHLRQVRFGYGSRRIPYPGRLIIARGVGVAKPRSWLSPGAAE